MEKLVSVVIPMYNAEQYIVDSIESVLAQTYQHFEIIVVDDGSTDNSVELLKPYSDKVKLIQQDNSGPAVARNRGIREAAGELIAFLDADDLWQRDKLEIQIENLGNCKWGYTDCIFMGGVNAGLRDSQLNKKLQGNILDDLICANFIGTSSVIADKQLLVQSGGFDASLRSIQDWDLWLRIASEYEVSYVDRPLVRYRVHSSSTSRSARKTLPNHMHVIDRSFRAIKAAKAQRFLYDKAQANSYSICSYIAEEENDFSFSFKCAYSAWNLDKFSRPRFQRLLKVFIKYVLHSAGAWNTKFS